MSAPGKSSFRKTSTTKYGVLFVVAWFVAVLVLSLSGRISKVHPAILLIGGFLIPAFTFFTFYFSSTQYRRIVLSQELRHMTLLQASRVTGIVFLIYYAQGKLPAEFALPTAISDMSIGISALFIARIVLPEKPTYRIAVLWHLSGIAGLIISGTMGVLTSPAPIGIFAFPITSQEMANFPLNLVPTFLGPLVLVFHLIALCILLDGYRHGRSPILGSAPSTIKS